MVWLADPFSVLVFTLNIDLPLWYPSDFSSFSWCGLGRVFLVLELFRVFAFLFLFQIWEVKWSES